jgi:hypothetical protein
MLSGNETSPTANIADGPKTVRRFMMLFSLKSAMPTAHALTAQRADQ